MKNILLIVIIAFHGCEQPSINLVGFHTCEAQIIEHTEDAIAIYAKSNSLCGQENIIALEKFQFRDSSGRAKFKIVDTVMIKLNKDQVLTTTFCNDWKTQNVILGTDATKENFGQIIKSWTYNKNRTKLIKVDPANLNCLNQYLIE